MSVTDVFTLVIALWGAAIATILGIREIKREKRKLRIILEFILGYDHYQIVIYNNGFRPVTISNVSIQPAPAYKGAPDPIAGTYAREMITGKVLNEEDEKKLPVTLSDGQFLVLKVSGILQDIVSHGKGRLKIIVYDIEGNSYRVNVNRYFDPETKTYRQLKNF